MRSCGTSGLGVISIQMTPMSILLIKPSYYSFLILKWGVEVMLRWLMLDKLKVNPSKTEVVLIGKADVSEVLEQLS